MFWLLKYIPYITGSSILPKRSFLVFRMLINYGFRSYIPKTAQERDFPHVKIYIAVDVHKAAPGFCQCVVGLRGKMLFYLGLIAYISPLTLADKQCAQNHYYDGLTEDCEPCKLRCSSPPAACTASCTREYNSDFKTLDNLMRN